MLQLTTVNEGTDTKLYHNNQITVYPKCTQTAFLAKLK